MDTSTIKYLVAWWTLQYLHLYNSILYYQFDAESLLQDPIKVTLSPPPDLVVSSLYTPGSAASGEAIFISYQVENRGLNVPYSTWWYDSLVSEKLLWLSSGFAFFRNLTKRMGFTFKCTREYIDTH